MYVVMIGNLDTPVENKDYSTFGPFPNAAAAEAFAEEWFEVIGPDTDTATVVQVLDPVAELAHEAARCWRMLCFLSDDDTAAAS